MPSKHIDEKVWKAVEKRTVQAVLGLKIPIKDTEMLKYLIIKGIMNLQDNEIEYFKDFSFNDEHEQS